MTFYLALSFFFVNNSGNSTVIPSMNHNNGKKKDKNKEKIQKSTIVYSDTSHLNSTRSNTELQKCYLKITNGERNKSVEDSDILIYCPDIRGILPLECILSNHKFYITEEFLSWYIGEQAAKKFFKYNVDGLCFSLSSFVYLRQLKEGILFTPEKADDDLIDLIGECGYIYEIQN